MSIFDRVLASAKAPTILEHGVFGSLRFVKGEGWENTTFTLWGFHDVDLFISAGLQGPSAAQTDKFTEFRDSEGTLWPRCVAALERVRGDLQARPGAFRVTGLSIPSLGPEGAGRLWTLWIDLEGDDHFMYGVQSDDGWKTLAAFADD